MTLTSEGWLLNDDLKLSDQTIDFQSLCLEIKKLSPISPTKIVPESIIPPNDKNSFVHSKQNKKKKTNEHSHV